MTPSTAKPRNTAEDKVPATATPQTEYKISHIKFALSSTKRRRRHSQNPEAIPTADLQDSNPHYTFPCGRNVRRRIPGTDLIRCCCAFRLVLSGGQGIGFQLESFERTDSRTGCLVGLLPRDVLSRGEAHSLTYLSLHLAQAGQVPILRFRLSGNRYRVRHRLRLQSICVRR